MNESEGIRIITHQFKPARLRLARELRGLQKVELAAKIGKTASAVSQFESGRTKPDAETVLRLAISLAVPPAFFSFKSVVPHAVGIEECHFRSLRSANQKDRRQLLAVGTLLSDLISTLEQAVDFPEVSIPEFKFGSADSKTIEGLAEAARRHWGLGDGPILNIVRLVENAGVIVCPMHSAFERVDAFSYWCEQRPFMFLLLGKNSPSRSRFDVAHELGHLIMHCDCSPGNPELEQQANKFASAFLLPKSTFGSECPSRLDWNHFLELKQRWKVSLAALLHRARELGKLSDASYRRAFIQLNVTGYRNNEPHEPDREWPTLVADAASIALEDSSVSELARTAGVPERDLKDILDLLNAGAVQANLLPRHPNRNIVPGESK